MSKARHVQRRRAGTSGSHARRVSKAGRTALAIAMSGIGLVVFAGAQVAGASSGDGEVTVRVVREINANGTWDHTAPVVEPGLADVTVTLTDAQGHALSGTTDAQGVLTLSPSTSSLVGGRYRVQVSNPNPGVLSPSFAAEQPEPGTTPLSSTVAFVDVSGNQPASVTTGFWNPHDFTQANPRIISGHQVDPVINTVAQGSLYTDAYTTSSQIGQTGVATQSQTGTVYGIGWNRTDKIAYSGAYAKRGAPYGPAGPGGLYWTDPASSQSGTFAVLPNAGSSQHHLQLLAPDNHDVGFVGVPGKEALGDVEVSEDGRSVYAMNLGDRKLYVYAIASGGRSGTLSQVVTPPASACSNAADWRPGAIGVRDGGVYVAGVCSGENGGQMSLRSVVWRYDAADLAAAPTKVLDQPMDYARGSTWPYPCPSPADPADRGTWHAWTDTTPACATDLNSFYAQPLLLDLEFEITGEMLLSYRDRWGDQYGTTTLSTQLDRFVQSAAMGDLLRACPDASGAFVLDENGGCGDVGSDGEYYDDNSEVAGFHPESAFSGIALAYNQATIAANAIDVTALFELDTANMSRTGSGGLLGTGWKTSEPQAPSGFLKGNGLADIEVMAEQAPLQIGNRVWYDADGDGTQEGGEDGVSGVHVTLADAGGSTVATTVTNAAGEYYFDSVADGVQLGADYTVRLDDPSDYVPGAPLDEAAWTLTGQDAGTGAAADCTDSDAALVGGFPRIAVRTGDAGEDDHCFDLGFVPSAPSIDIVNVDGRAPVPVDAVDGPDPIGGGQSGTSANWPDGVDADTPEDAVAYDVDASGTTGPQPVRFVVTNTGNVPLAGVEVADESGDGPELTGIECDFPGVAGTANGTSWSGPMAPGTSFPCLATLVLEAGDEHADTAQVTAVPVGDPDGPQVGDEDQFHAVAGQPPAPPLDPAIDIVDVDGRAEVPSDAVDGADPIGDGQEVTADNWAAGVDADTEADQVTYQVDESGSTGPQPVRFVVTNTGTAPLGSVVVLQENLQGPDLHDVQCDFPGIAGTANGTSWDGPMAVGSSFGCKATVTLQAGQRHADRAQVTAVGLDAGGNPVPDPTSVGDEDQFHAVAAQPKPVLEPAIDIVDVDGRAEVPADAVDGPDPIGSGQTVTSLSWSADVDADDTDNAVGYEVDGSGSTGPQPVRFVVTNTGTSPLASVEVADETLDGPPLSALTCDFPGVPGSENGTSWAGPFAVGDSFSCSAELTLGAGQEHANRAQVTALELDADGNPVPSPRTVGDEDQFHAFAPVPEPTTTPAIDIVDVDGRAEVPASAVDGADPVGGGQSETRDQWGSTEDADTAADAATYEVVPPAGSGPQLVRFVVTNTGTAPLTSIEVAQETLSGPGLTGLECAFPMPATPGTTWDGPLAVGASFQCTAVLTLAAGQQHGDLARVTAVSVDDPDGPRVGDEDRFHATTVAPGIRITKKDQVTGAEADGTADPVVFEPGETRTITMPVTNTGDLPLTSVEVTDRTVGGTPMADLECRFPGETAWTSADGGSVAWAASVPGSGNAETLDPDVTFGCRGTLTMEAGEPDHASVVEVDATSPAGNALDDENAFHAAVAGVPAIDIVEYDGRATSPSDPVDGPDPVGGGHQGPTLGSWTPEVDADTAADAIRYPADGKPHRVLMVVTNTGTSPLRSVEVRSVTSSGPDLEDVSCDFSRAAQGAPTSGTRWNGRFAPGRVFLCSATVSLPVGTRHADTTSVRARDVRSGVEVADEDQLHAVVPVMPAPVPPTAGLPDAGGPTLGLAVLGALLVAAGTVLVRGRNRGGQRHRR